MEKPNMSQKGDAVFPKEVENIYSSIFYEVYKPCVDDGVLLMRYRKTLTNFIKNNIAVPFPKLHTGSSIETYLLFEDFDMDLDVMQYEEGKYAQESDHEELTKIVNSNKDIDCDSYFILNVEKYPGFVQVHHVCLDSIDKKMNSLRLLSSSDAIENFNKSNPHDNGVIHGPALTFKDPGMLDDFSNDLVFCIQWPKWPSQAREWITRERKFNYPSKDLVNVITQQGCHIVPIDHPHVAKPDTNWRISFSNAECLLIEGWVVKQRITFHLMKYFMKCYKVEHNKPITSKVIGSYHLKSLLFWYSEKYGTEVWVKKSVLELIVELLVKLKEYFTNGYFPNYWIPQCNLLHYITDVGYSEGLLDEMHCMRKFLNTCLQTPTLQNLIELESLPKDLEHSLSLHEAILEVLPDWKTNCTLSGEINKLEMVSGCWTSVLQNISAFPNIDNLLLKFDAMLSDVGSSLDEHFKQILKGRFLFVKARRSAQETEPTNLLLVEAIECFKEAKECSCLAKDVVRTLSYVFLANIYYISGKFDGAIEMCDTIITNDIDPNFNTSNIGEIPYPEIQFTSPELGFYEMEEEEIFDMLPNVFAVTLKVRCLQSQKKDLSSIDREYAENMLECSKQTMTWKAQYQILCWVLQQLDNSNIK